MLVVQLFNKHGICLCVKLECFPGMGKSSAPRSSKTKTRKAGL